MTSGICTPAAVIGRPANRAATGHGRSGVAGGDRNGANRGAVSRSLTVLAAASGILLAAALLAGCGEAARPAASGSPTTTASAAVRARHPGPPAHRPARTLPQSPPEPTPGPPPGVAGIR